MSNLRPVPRDYDLLALDALLDPDKAQGEKTLTRLASHARGEHTCPDCGSQGPHDVQHNGFEVEFACQDCGMQHVVPPI